MSVVVKSPPQSRERGLFSVVANIFVSFIGGGVLGLPYAFKEAGVIEGVVIMMAVGCISIYAMLLIVKCKYRLMEHRSLLLRTSRAGGGRFPIKPGNGAKTTTTTTTTTITITGAAEDCFSLHSAKASRHHRHHHHPKEKVPDLSYGDLGYFAMGWFGRFVVDIVLLVSQIGFCCAYLIFICENMSDNLEGLSLNTFQFEIQSAFRIGCLVVLLPPLCLLAFFRHLNSLSVSSFLAQCSSLLAFAVVFWFDFQHIHLVTIHPKKISLAGLPFFLAISIYCYEGAGMVLSLESSIAKEKRNRFNFVFISTMAVVTFLYIAFGICGYLSFGKATNPIITLNLPKGKSLDFALIVKSFLCLSMFFTYPVMLFPASKLLETHLITEPDKSVWKGNILRMVLVMLTGLVVVTIPDFANLMALIGATCCTLLAFILPGLFHFIIFKGSTTLVRKSLDVVLIIVGVIGAMIGTYDAVNRMRASPSSPSPSLSDSPSPSHHHLAAHIAARLLNNSTTHTALPK